MTFRKNLIHRTQTEPKQFRVGRLRRTCVRFFNCQRALAGALRQPPGTAETGEPGILAYRLMPSRARSAVFSRRRTGSAFGQERTRVERLADAVQNRRGRPVGRLRGQVTGFAPGPLIGALLGARRRFRHTAAVPRAGRVYPCEDEVDQMPESNRKSGMAVKTHQPLGAHMSVGLEKALIAGASVGCRRRGPALRARPLTTQQRFQSARPAILSFRRHANRISEKQKKQAGIDA